MRELTDINQQLVTSLLYLGLDADPALEQGSQSEALTAAEADGYRSISRIGTGGFSDIFASVELQTRKDRVLKTIRSDLEAQRAGRAASMLAAESEFLRRMDDPRIVRYYGLGGEGASRYIVLEYLPGDNLNRVTEVGLHSINALIDLAEELIQSVAVVHGNHIAHGDIKPGNFILRDEDMPVLIDFGMACDLDQPLQSAFVRLNRRGTRRYMAPELIDGRAEHPTTQSDVYSLCLVILELLSSNVEDAAIPRRIGRVLDAGLSVDPDARPGNASELLAEFRKARARRRVQAPVMLAAASLAFGVVFFAINFPNSYRQGAEPTNRGAITSQEVLLPTVKWEGEHRLLMGGEHGEAAAALQDAAASEQTWAWKLLSQWAESGVEPVAEQRYTDFPGPLTGLAGLSPMGSTAAYVVGRDNVLWVLHQDGTSQKVDAFPLAPRSIALTSTGDEIFVTTHDHRLIRYAKSEEGWLEQRLDAGAEVSFARLCHPGDHTALHVQLMNPPRYRYLSTEPGGEGFSWTEPIPNDGMLHGGNGVALLAGDRHMQVLQDGLPVKDAAIPEDMKTPISIAYSTTNDLLACGAREGEVWVCGPDSAWRMVVDLPTESPVLDIAMDRSGGIAFVAARKLYVVDIATGRILLVFGDDFDAEFVVDLAWNEKRQELSAVTNTRILRWSVAAGWDSR